MLWDGSCGICAYTVLWHYNNLDSTEFRYMFVQHPKTSTLLRKCKVSKYDALDRALLIEDGIMMRGALGMCRAAMHLKQPWCGLGAFGESPFVCRAVREMFYNMVSENRGDPDHWASRFLRTVVFASSIEAFTLAMEQEEEGSEEKMKSLFLHDVEIRREEDEDFPQYSVALQEGVGSDDSGSNEELFFKNTLLFEEYREKEKLEGAVDRDTCRFTMPLFVFTMAGFLFLATIKKTFENGSPIPSAIIDFGWLLKSCAGGFLNSRIFGGESPWLHELARWTFFFTLCFYIVRFMCSFSVYWVKKHPTTNCPSSEALPFGTAVEERFSFNDTGFEDKYTFYKIRTGIIRAQGLCYAAGFLVSAMQHRATWGSDGLEPIFPATQTSKYGLTPLFWFLRYGDLQLEFVSWLGYGSALVLLTANQRYACGAAILCWLAYMSIINLRAGMTYHYGWEWETCELGILAIFLSSPIFWPESSKVASMPPSTVIIFLFRWFAFHSLIGAGMSKCGSHSSPCWFDLTCTTTHYFTQPIPNPIAYTMHFLPLWAHKLEVGIVFFEQLVLPFFFLAPHRGLRIAAGCLEIWFQFCIVFAGNYSHLNFLAALPCIALLDDQFLVQCGNAIQGCFRSINFRAREAIAPLFPTDEAEAEETEPLIEERRDVEAPMPDPPSSELNEEQKKTQWNAAVFHKTACWVVFFIMLNLSGNPLRESFTDSPWINSYDPLFLMTSQGVFGFVNAHRVNLVLEYSHDTKEPTSWKPLPFKALPSEIDKAPRFLSPYHSRLDWQTWIDVTAHGEHRDGSIVVPPVPSFIKTLLYKIMSGDQNAAALLSPPNGLFYPSDPTTFQPPKAIRASMYMYEFEDTPGSKNWWKRELLEKPEVYSMKDGEGTAPLYPGRPWRLPMMFVFATLGLVACILPIAAVFWWPMTLLQFGSFVAFAVLLLIDYW